MVIPGQVAPEFMAHDVFGATVNLAASKSKYVLVAFMRYAGCPYCNLAIHRLSIEYPMLQQNGCDVVAFVQSDKAEIIKNIYDRHAVRPPFPIIADHARLFYDMYGVKSSVKAVGDSIIDIPHWLHAVKDHGFKQGKINGSYFLVPAMFLISTKTKKVVKTMRAGSLYDHQTFTEIYQALTFDEQE